MFATVLYGISGKLSLRSQTVAFRRAREHPALGLKPETSSAVSGAHQDPGGHPLSPVSGATTGVAAVAVDGCAGVPAAAEAPDAAAAAAVAVAVAVAVVADPLAALAIGVAGGVRLPPPGT